MKTTSPFLACILLIIIFFICFIFIILSKINHLSQNKLIFYFFTDDLTIDYQFTFNLSKKDDRHYTQINFKNSPPKPDVDADFSITCSVLAKMNITIKTGTLKSNSRFLVYWLVYTLLDLFCLNKF